MHKREAVSANTGEQLDNDERARGGERPAEDLARRRTVMVMVMPVTVIVAVTLVMTVIVHSRVLFKL